MKRFFVLAAVAAIVSLVAVPQAQAQGAAQYGGLQYRLMNFNGWSTNAPTASVTNRVADIQAATPLAIECFGIQPTGATVTISRVAGCVPSWNGTNTTYSGGITTAIGSIVTDSSGNGICTNPTLLYVVMGDFLVRSSTTATNGMVRFFASGY